MRFLEKSYIPNESQQTQLSTFDDSLEIFKYNPITGKG